MKAIYPNTFVLYDILSYQFLSQPSLSMHFSTYRQMNERKPKKIQRHVVFKLIFFLRFFLIQNHSGDQHKLDGSWGEKICASQTETG